MDYEKITNYIDQAMDEFPGIKVVVFTGGECFLLGEHLADVIRHAASYNIFTRVVSNAFWAGSYEEAIETLTPLVEAGLKEINFSTGDNHQKFVRFDNIVNAVLASYDLGIKTICISVEAPPNAIFKSDDITCHVKLEPLIEEGALFLINAAWMQFKIDDENLCELTSNTCKEYNTPCYNLFSNIVINPYSQLLACCGITVEFNKYLKLGNLEEFSIKELYDTQFNDLYKFWLYVDGPKFIYDKINRILNKKSKNLIHNCAYCMELIKDEESLNIIKSMIMEELPSIIYRYKMRTSHLKA